MAMLRRTSSLVLSFGLMCSGLTALAQNATVTGTVAYLQRIALPPNAVVKVTLEDVSLADAPAKVLAEKEIPTAGKQVPIPFELPYSSSDIQPSHRYSVRATIKAEDKLLFTSTTSYPVLTNGAPSEVKIMVQQAQSERAPSSGLPLEGTHWTLAELAGEKVSSTSGQQIPYLQFTANGTHVAGSTGCNRLSGMYEKNGSELKIHPLASTLMACVSPAMERENKFNNALGKVSSYRVRGNTLTLLHDKTVLARFKAQTKTP